MERNTSEEKIQAQFAIKVLAEYASRMFAEKKQNSYWRTMHTCYADMNRAFDMLNGRKDREQCSYLESLD